MTTMRLAVMTKPKIAGVVIRNESLAKTSGKVGIGHSNVTTGKKAARVLSES
jgi:hypothetical protein